MKKFIKNDDEFICENLNESIFFVILQKVVNVPQICKS